eukprot:gb/GEZN01009860.1/.p1 GENE.gb/GEZN01009860.1/~~gb/GEZN01009860.1/.p1  ORF type:complete len:318 (-),score=59.93 gb/GEZN01009860.1/:229-1182(-)
MDYGGGKTFESYAPGGGSSEWSSTQDGGGFNASQAGGSQDGSPGAGKKKKFEQQSLLAVTISQLKKAEQRESKYVIDGKEISQITFVGLVVSMDMQSTNINYMIDDGTGMLTVRVYIDQDEQDPQQFQQDQYVRVVGNLRSLNGEMSVVAFQLTKVVDHNEITFHLLEVIHSHLYNTRGPLAGAAAGVAGAGAPLASHSNSGAPTYGGSAGVKSEPASYGAAHGVKSEPASYGAAHGQVISAGDTLDNSNISAVQQAVLKIFNDHSSNDQGVAVQQVCQQLSNIPPTEIHKAVEFLCNEGHLYSTIDDEHFRCTSAD